MGLRDLGKFLEKFNSPTELMNIFFILKDFEAYEIFFKNIHRPPKSMKISKNSRGL